MLWCMGWGWRMLIDGGRAMAATVTVAVTVVVTVPAAATVPVTVPATATAPAALTQ